MGNVIFNGVSSLDLGIVVQSPPEYDIPEKDYELTHIEGRNGDIAINKKSYKNSSRKYYFASIFKTGTGFIENARKISEWLTSTDGYARLEDTYDPDIYRMALFKDSKELTDIYGEATALEVEFECKPQKFLKSGEKVFDINELSIVHTNPDCIIYKINNPTNENAKPKIFFNSESLNFSISKNYDATITMSEDKELVKFLYNENLEDKEIDCDICDCYSSQTYLNDKLTLISNEFPILRPGINYIRVYTTIGSDEYFKIEPRWWTL